MGGWIHTSLAGRSETRRRWTLPIFSPVGHCRLASSTAMASLTDEERDYQYSPSRWSKRDFPTPDAVVDDHCHTLRTGSATVREQARAAQCGVDEGAFASLNVKHSPAEDDATDEATLDIFYPLTFQSEDEYPVLVYIHGGYWQALEKTASCWCADVYRKQGIAFVALGYDLCPSVSFPSLVRQVTNGIAEVAKRFPGQPIYLCGHSAGGHLVGMALCTDWEKLYGISSAFIHGFVAVSGCYDLRLLQRTYVNGALKLDEGSAAAFSPVLHQLTSTGLVEGCKGIIAYGENESDEFKRISQEYYQYLQPKLPALELMELPKEDHFTIIERLQDTTYALTVAALKLIVGGE